MVAMEAVPSSFKRFGGWGICKAVWRVLARSARKKKHARDRGGERASSLVGACELVGAERTHHLLQTLLQERFPFFIRQPNGDPLYDLNERGIAI